MNNSHIRRILTFPAMQPSSEISPTALFDGLIALSNNIISIHSNSVPIHRQNIVRITRQVGLLLHYLHDILGSREQLKSNYDVVVSFLELYVTLQRAKSLVEDCARPGARLWILAQSERFLEEFRLFTRSLSTVIDVLGLADIDVSQESKDLLRFLGEQSWKIVVEMEPADAQILRLLWRVLDEFRNGVAPAKGELRRIVKHLGVKSWVECSEEISFLEEMIKGEIQDDRVVSLASSLIGFLVYCRVILFDCVDRCDNRIKLFRLCGLKAIDGIKEDDLRCPISLELMMDPVTLATGQTYERSSILKWFKSGSLICPVTGKKLDEAALVPNSNISSIIQDYCHEKNLHFDVQWSKNKQEKSKGNLPFSSVNTGASRMTAEFLAGRLKYGSNQEKNKAASEIRKLSKSNIFNSACFIEAGAVPWLLNLLSSSDSSAQDNAVASLLNLSKNKRGRMAIVEAGGLSLIIDMTQLGTKADSSQNAAAILSYVSSDAKFQKEVGDVPKAIPALVGLLIEGTSQAKKNAAVTLFGLLMHPDNLRKILAAGAVPALTKLVSSETDDLASDSLIVLTKIAEGHEGATAIINSAAVPKLVNTLGMTASQPVKECCISLLLSLCNSGGEEVIRLLEQIPMLTPLLYSLTIGGSPQVSKKAKLLLKYIHLIYEPDYPAVVTPTVQDTLVRVQ